MNAGYLQQIRGARTTRRRLFLRTAAGGTGIALTALAACKNKAGSRPGTSSQSGAAAQAQRGGYLSHMLPYSPANIDPDTTEDLTGYGFTEMDWYDPLLRINYTPSPDWRIANKSIPWLAESFEQVDPTTYTFTIRKGVKFHNGDLLTAADVLFSYTRIKDPAVKSNPGVVRYLQNLDKIEASGDYSVRMTTKTPDADFLANVSSRNVVIVSKRFVEGGADLTKTAMGTGPFKLASYQRDSSAVGTRFADSWLKTGPYLDGVKLVLKSDDATLSASFAAGAVDILIRHDSRQAGPVLKANPKAVSERAPADQVYSVLFNQTKAPFSDDRVRRAVHLAIDRQAADKAVNFGEGIICGPVVVAGKTGWTIPADELAKLPGYRQPKTQDLADAKQLLAAAGIAGGLKAGIAYSSDTESQQGYAEVVQAQLKQIGIDAQLQPLDNASYVQRRVKPDFDMVITADGGLSTPGSYAYSTFYSSGVYAKPAGIHDPELDKVIDTQATEFDFNKRGALFQELQRTILDKAYNAPISTPLLVQLHQSWIHDWTGAKNNRAVVMNPDAIWIDPQDAPADRRQAPS
jgi:peptide/nickel transport system substrate-binding protein